VRRGRSVGLSRVFGTADNPTRVARLGGTRPLIEGSAKDSTGGCRPTTAPAALGRIRIPIQELARQIRRQPSRLVASFADAVVAAAAVAVAVPAVLTVTNWQPSGRRRPMTPHLAYTITVNGLAPTSFEPRSSLPRFVIFPGEDLSITVDAIVPANVTVSGLWLGITAGILALRRNGPPDHMSPVLVAVTDTTLTPGGHHFTFNWAVPAELGPGTKRELSAQMVWHARSSGLSERIVAQLEVQARPDT